MHNRRISLIGKHMAYTHESAEHNRHSPMYLYIMLICLLLLSGCSHFNLTGDYTYNKKGELENHSNDFTMTYNDEIEGTPYKINQKITHDLKSIAYYEISYEIAFW